MGVTRRVVIVGAGFGGLSAARALAGPDVEVEVVDRRNHHLFQPLLYQVATAGLEPSDIAYAVRGIVRKERGVRFTAADIVGADLDARVLHTAGGRDIPYDTLVLAAGARTADFGITGVAEHAFGLKSLNDAMAIRQHMLEQFERCAVRPELVDDGALSIVVVGGGPTGIEMAGAMSELFNRVMRADFPELDLTRAQVELVEMAPEPLGPFHPKLRKHAVDQLERRGVTMHLGRSVKEVTDDGVLLDDGTFLSAATCVWAAGVEAEPLGRMLGLETGKAGRIVVDGSLRVPDRPNVFVIGDLAAATDRKGELLPQLAPVAMQQGRHVAKVMDAVAEGRKPPVFRYTDKGSMATIGRGAAVAQVPGGIRFGGTLAWLAWLVLHIYFLIGFRNRISVLVNWAWNYLTWDRAARVVHGVVAPEARDDGAPEARDDGAPQGRDDGAPEGRDEASERAAG